MGMWGISVEIVIFIFASIQQYFQGHWKIRKFLKKKKWINIGEEQKNGKKIGISRLTIYIHFSFVLYDEKASCRLISKNKCQGPSINASNFGTKATEKKLSEGKFKTRIYGSRRKIWKASKMNDRVVVFLFFSHPSPISGRRGNS